MGSEFNIFTIKELKYVTNLFELPDKKLKADLIAEIVKAKYTLEEVRIEIDTWEGNTQKGRLDKLEQEKKEEKIREEKIELARLEERLELARLDAQIKIAQAQIPVQTNANNVIANNSMAFNMSKHLQPFKDEGDISLYLTNFERMCTQLNFEKETWSIRLTSVLSPAANEVVARLSEEDCKDYDKVRASLLKKYKLTSEVFRSKFRYGKRKPEQSYAEFAYQLKINFNEWLKCEEIEVNFDKLVQLMCLEKFYNSIPSEMRFWIEDRNKLKTIEEASDLADVYVTKRGPIADKNYNNINFKTGKSKYENKTVVSNQKENVGNSQVTTETINNEKIDKSTFDKRRPFKCYGCGEVGHFKNSPECPKTKTALVTTTDNSKELDTLFEPYTILAKVNGVETKLLRDSAASYDIVHSDIIKEKDYIGKCVNVRGILSTESVALPVAKVELNFPEIGKLTTEAAVTSQLPNGYPYLLSNRTWEMMKNTAKFPEQQVFVLTRSKAKKILENKSLIEDNINKKPSKEDNIIVEAEGKEPRPVIDYRALNAITVPQQHPVPNIEVCVERCSNAKYLTLIDVVRAYWQIGMTERASKYAAFITHRGIFEPITLAFGLQSAPFSFQRLIDKILEGMNEFAEPFLDDVAVHSMSWEEHLIHLRKVLSAMYKAGLTIKATKCEWGRAEVIYLGHKIGQGYRKPSEVKVAAIMEFRRPETKRDIRAFLGITGYYNHYIPMYSDIASPLTDALRKDAKNRIEWDEQKEDSFQRLKNELISGKVLKAPNYNREFIVQTDCSKKGMGVTLSQCNEQGEEHPVLYLSKKLTDREQVYSASELECAALVWAVGKLKPYLYLNHFTVETDHCPLTWLKQMSNKNGRLLRWTLSLQMLNFTVVYKPGKKCGNVDSLSRYFV